MASALDAGTAATVFAVALLAAGQKLVDHRHLARQIVMEGFTGLRWPAWVRRQVSRLLAMALALFVVTTNG